MFSPPEITMSLARPTTTPPPSSVWRARSPLGTFSHTPPTSPVRGADVAPGAGPRQTDTPGAGQPRPTPAPVAMSGRRAIENGPVSVAPYTLHTGTPRASNSATWSGGRGLDPAHTALKDESGVWAHAGWSDRAFMVAGTWRVSVGRTRSNSASVSVGAKRASRCTWAPRYNAGSVWMHNPPTWKSGKTVRTRSSGTTDCSWAAIAMLASKLAWVWTAPFGRPVVPAVYTSNTAAPGAATSGGGAVSATERCPAGSGPAGTLVSADNPLAWAAQWLSCTNTRGVQSASTCCHSAWASLWFNGTRAAPSRATASSKHTTSGWAQPSQATRSPGWTPRWCNTPASWATRSAKAW